jgi:hypothetical protein
MASLEFNRVLQTTIAEYLLGAEDNVIRNRKFLALMKAKGRITFGHAGNELNWGIQYKRRGLIGYADGDTVPFSRSDTFKRSALPWRGYVMQDLVTDKEKLMNRDRPALIKYISELVEAMTEDITDRYHAQLYVDGNAAGNSKAIHGLESFLGSATPQSGNFVGVNAAVYGGLSTVLGNYGGSWTGTWPIGSGDSEYDFWSPVIVDYTNTGWGYSPDTWANTSQDALRFGIIKGKRNDSQKGMIDIVLLDGELYRAWEKTLDTKERIFVQVPSDAMGARPTLRNLGFGDTQSFEGAEITWEFGVPLDAAGAGQGYGLNIDEMELCCMDDRIFKNMGPYYDEASMADRYMIRQFGNMKCNPRYFAKWQALT